MHTYPTQEASVKLQHTLGGRVFPTAQANSSETQNQSPKQTQIEGVANELERLISILEEEIHFLEQRLLPLLSPIDTHALKAEGIKESPRPVRCPLADKIDGQAHRIRFLNCKIEGLRANLEI